MSTHPETTPATRSGRPFTAVQLALAAIPLAAGLLALALGQDASWDLRNYHLYNPHAYVTGRMGHDVAVAQVATYYNPLMHLPFYYAFMALPPRIMGFLLGMIPGFGAILLYAIAKSVTPPLSSPSRTEGFCLAIALTGFVGANAIAELGTSFGDNILSLPVLIAIWLILRFRDRFDTSPFQGVLIAMTAGLFAGAAFGLKQPFAVYCVGICLAFFGLNLPIPKRIAFAIVFGIGVLTGAATTGGFWMMEMWQRFQNPLFPYFNQHFHSPWIPAESFRDERFLPKDPFMALLFPFLLTVNPMQVGEIFFRDTRFAVLYLLLILWLGVWIVRRFRPGAMPDRGEGATNPDFRGTRRFLIVFLVVSFLLWMRLFSVYRYIAACEMLAPLAVFLVMDGLASTARDRTRWTLACFLVILITLSPGNWGRRPWASDYFGVTVPKIPNPARTLVLMTGYEPMAYMIPFFPSQVRFLRVHSYMTGPSERPNGLDRFMKETISSHQGDIFLLYRGYEERIALDALAAYGLKMAPEEAVQLAPHVEPHPEQPFYFRTVTRIPPPEPPAPKEIPRKNPASRDSGKKGAGAKTPAKK